MHRHCNRAAGPSVILTSHALDGEGGTLRNARIGIANGRITSLAAPSVGAQPPQAAPLRCIFGSR